MGDSDDEYERRRARDKFRRERSDYQERGDRGGRGDDRGRRDDYVDGRRELWTRERVRRDYGREVDLRRRERFSPPPRHDMSPPMKKMRRDWDDRGYDNYEGGYGGGGGGGGMMGGHGGGGGGSRGWPGMSHDMHPPHGEGRGPGGGGGYGPGAGGGGHRDLEMCPTQPPMMTFKQFLGSQDDGISDEDAVRKYNDYKLDFRRQQLNDFFLAHKDEEWFKSKYQPEEVVRRKNEQVLALNKRVEVFLNLMDNPRFAELSVDCDKSEELLKLLDAVVIKLEGGTDLDLKVLDEPLVDEFKITKPLINAAEENSKKKGSGEKKESWENWDALDRQEQRDRDRERERAEGARDRKEGSAKPTKVKEEPAEGEEDNDENWSVSGKGEDEDSGRPDSAASSGAPEPKRVKEEKTEEEEEEEEEKMDTSDVKSEKEEGEEGEEPNGKEEEGEGAGESKPETQEEKEPEVLSPRPLHRTCSIFLRNLAPTITKQEVESMCKRFSGFLRVAIADPQPERRFFRRGWVTFERGVNIKEICWNLNNIRLRECELGAIVNRDLTRRIRPCNGITSHRQVARADMKLAAKIIQNLDQRHGLWAGEGGAEMEGCGRSFGLISRNPLLKNITEHLIEEADAEEEELLGRSTNEESRREGEANDASLDKDDALLKMLDRLLLYLRVVHSVDYYNHSDYPNEDEMPNRCGIMHGRGIAPSIKVTQAEINDYVNSFEQRMTPFLSPTPKLSEDEASKLGKKDPNTEVDKFIVANTQELGKDKWLCPLSGKKFKGPEFVRKHIFNKHGEKVEEVKKEVEYFNNYLVDTKRPQLPEHPVNRPHRGGPGGEGMREGYGGGPPFGGPGFAPPPPPHYPYGPHYAGRMPGPYPGAYATRAHFPAEAYHGGAGAFFGPKRGGGGGRNRGDTREIIGYHDLDAPDDIDVF